jgi:transmembrane sensor
MNTDPTYINDLITRYFSGESSEEDLRMLAAWLSGSDLNKKLFEEYRKSWLAVERQSIHENINVDEEWNAFKHKITGREVQPSTDAKVISINRGRRLVYRYISIAAVFILIAVSSLVLYSVLNNVKEQQLVASAQNVKGTLPDGSIITLAPGAVINYPEKYNRKVREVRLKGEAYFEVKHDPEQPFIIDAGNDIRIEVLGTSFYVNTNNEAGNVEVVLTSGRVAVYYASAPENKTILDPGEKVELSKISNTAEKKASEDNNYMAWKTGKLEFTNKKLDAVIGLLNKVYHAKVRLSDPKIGNCTITATFDNQSLESVLKVISETLALQVTHKGDIIEVSGKGCN